jgi:hypothetical protein
VRYFLTLATDNGCWCSGRCCCWVLKDTPIATLAMLGGFLVTAGIASFSTQSLTQFSFALAPSSSGGGTGSSGLAFTGNGATYDGRPISLSDILNDSSGRFTDAQKQETRQAQQLLDALSTIVALDQFLSSPSGSGSQGAANDGVRVSLSPNALQLLNEMNAQGGSNAANAPNPGISSSSSLSISVTTDTLAAANVMASSDAGTVSASAASAQYSVVSLMINFRSGTIQSYATMLSGQPTSKMD